MAEASQRRDLRSHAEPLGLTLLLVLPAVVGLLASKVWLAIVLIVAAASLQYARAYSHAIRTRREPIAPGVLMRLIEGVLDDSGVDCPYSPCFSLWVPQGEMLCFFSGDSAARNRFESFAQERDLSRALWIAYAERTTNIEYPAVRELVGASAVLELPSWSSRLAVPIVDRNSPRRVLAVLSLDGEGGSPNPQELEEYKLVRCARHVAMRLNGAVSVLAKYD